jgi:hypothetical protein
MSRRAKKKRRAAILNGRCPLPSPEPQQQPEPRRWTAYLSPTHYGLLAVLVGVAAYRFIVLADEPAPPGADPGNWLAFSHQLFGTSVKAASSVYFPVVPALLKALLVFLPALMATKVLGVGVSVVMGIPFYLIVRRGCSPLFSAALTLAFLLTGYQEEVFIFGGYPQLLATTFLLLTVYWLMDGLISGGRRPLLLAAASTALMAGTHHFTLLLAAPVLLVLGAALLIQERPGIRPFLRNAGIWALAAAVFTLPFLPWYVDFLTLMRGNPANPGDFSVLDMGRVTSYVFLENRPLWLALLIIAGALTLAPFFGERAGRIRPAALAILAGPFLGFVLTSEVRSFQLIEAGTVLSLALPVAAVEQHLSQTRVMVTFRQVERFSLGLALAAFLTVIASSGDDRLMKDRAVYQIVDGPALQALNWLHEQTPPGARVVANESIGRVSYAWWVEGYAQRPTYSLIEPGYLSFAEEQEQSSLATRLVDEETPASEVEAILQQTGIEYIFLDKRTGGRFKSLLSKSAFYLSLENEEFAILHHPQAEARAKP